jgi:hypothetical protein
MLDPDPDEIRNPDARNEPLDSMWTRYLLKSLNSSQVGRNTMMLGTSVLEPGYDLHIFKFTGPLHQITGHDN